MGLRRLRALRGFLGASPAGKVGGFALALAGILADGRALRGLGKGSPQSPHMSAALPALS